MMDRIVIVSGYFNPMHVGHLDYLEEAKKLGDVLIVIVNNDEQVKIKGSTPFMSLRDRLRIVKALDCVNRVVPSVDQDSSVVETLNILHTKYSLEWDFDKMIFANGGDRKADDIPEYQLCEDRGITMAFNVGGGKTQSSSTLLGKVGQK
jgi:cytidyltransferase-like protein